MPRMGDHPMTVLSVAEVAARAGVKNSRTIYTYLDRRRRGLPGAGIPLPDAKLADRPAWNEETIQPWLETRQGRVDR
jgi:predicted DNA-binding transcriptional regulator AlpA